MKFIIKELSVLDVQEVAEIYIGAYGDKNWNEKWTSGRAVDRISELISSPHCKGFVCCIDSKIAGCIICEILTWSVGKQLEIKELFVGPDYQRQGVGRFLIQHLQTIRSEYDISEIVLWTNKCPALLSFYENVGFKFDSETVRFMMT